ncbi:MAG: hemerythrin domain-containing protein [Anaerolineae bacterium]|nr:hemerythrin domain-containing protein [Anaerolineae bacterium]
MLRVHRAISRAVDVALKHNALYIKQGFPESRTQKGFSTYVWCLRKLLHAHHVTEDKGMFPYLRPKLPDAPYAQLMQQHTAMGPLLAEIRSNLNRIKSGHTDQALEKLHRALERTWALWHEHIQLEEAHFGPDAVKSALSIQERQKAAKITAAHSARHQFPLSLMVPFLLYNMPPEDRSIMVKLMPPFIPPMLTLWKPRWQIMAPFLLE